MIKFIVKIGSLTLLSAVLVSCGGGGGSTAPSVTSPGVGTQASGVSTAKATTADGNFYALPNTVSAQQISLTLASGTKLSDLAISIQNNPLASVEATDTGFVLRVVSQSQAGLQSVDVLVKNNVTGQSEILRIPVTVLAATKTTTGNVSSTGGSLGTSSGQTIQFPAGNNLPSAVTATLDEVVTPNGETIQNISFDRDVSSSDLTVVFPNMNTALEASAVAIDSLTVKSADRVTKATQVTTTPTAYASDPANRSLGANWLVFRGQAEGMLSARLPVAAPKKVSTLAKLYGISLALIPGQSLSVAGRLTSFAVTTKTVSELNSVLPYPSGTTYDLGNALPVLFVHGFTPPGVNVPGIGFQSPGLGGGLNTWQLFPSLVQKSGHIPFEFRWNTNARFVDAAGDLATAINVISQKTGGKKVLVIAHSFGGVLARSMLEGLAETVSTTSLNLARSKVAGLITLGSPHSGIFPTAKSATASDGTTSVAMPAGQDSPIFALCPELSCHLMGAPILTMTPEVAATYGVNILPGQHAASLAAAQANLPAIPIYAGIGLRTNYQNSAAVFGPGDALISYAGQRFLPSDGTSGLRTSVAVGAATVTESILGISRDVKPGNTPTAAELADTYRGNGYLHSGFTGASVAVSSTSSVLVTTIDDGVLGTANNGSASAQYRFGVEAAPQTNCGLVASCQHAGFLLFQKMVGLLATSPPVVTPSITSVSCSPQVVNQLMACTVTGTNFLSGSTSLISASSDKCSTLVASGVPTSTQVTFVCTPTSAGSGALSFFRTGLTTPIYSQQVAIATAGTVISKIPHSGTLQSQCYGSASGALISCDSVQAIGLSGLQKQDGMRTSINPMSYSQVSKLGGGVYPTTDCVKDDITGLIWEGKPTAGQRSMSNTYTNYDDLTIAQKFDPATGSIDFPSVADLANPTNTLGYVSYVNGIALCGFSDWRLPNKVELQMIIDFGVVGDSAPKVNSNYFLNTSVTPYWTSSAYGLDRPAHAWNISFGSGISALGGSVSNNRSSQLAVRLVRGSFLPTQSTRFVIQGSGTEVLDTFSNLIWKRCPQGTAWEAASMACVARGSYGEIVIGSGFLNTPLQAFSLSASESSWRLPSVRELVSLFDANGYVNQNTFPSANSFYTTNFCSSTPVVSRRTDSSWDQALWTVNLYYGYVSPFNLPSCQVRLVRQAS